MNAPTPTRPRQVTLAAWLIMVGSVIVVAMVFERIGGLHTLETRESVEKFLAEPPGSDLGVGVDSIITVLRVTSMVAAGCATAAAILGYQVLRRSRSARLALTLIAVPLFLTGMVTGGFISSVVAAAALMLWLQPSRDWFRDPGEAGEPAPPARPAAPYAGQPNAGQPYGPQSYGAPQAPVSDAPAAVSAVSADDAVTRPPAVALACVLTWVASAITTLGLVATGVVIAVDPDLLLDDVHRRSPDLAEQGVSDGVLLGVALAMLGALVVWSVAAAVLAALVLRGIGWARIVLIISAGVASAIGLAATLAGAFLVILLVAAATGTIVLLARPDSAAWFQARRTSA